MIHGILSKLEQASTETYMGVTLPQRVDELDRKQRDPTGGHFACACVNPLNNNSVGASNLTAGNRKLSRKVTVLLKAISLVL